MAKFLKNVVVSPSTAPGSEGWKVASILLAPLRASLTDSELLAIIGFLQSTSRGEVVNIVASYERENAMIVTDALQTRFGDASESAPTNDVQRVKQLAARYMDIGAVMPPERTVLYGNWFDSLFETSASGGTVDAVQTSIKTFLGKVGDAWNEFTVPQDPTLSTEATADADASGVRETPSAMMGSQSPGYRTELYRGLTTNIWPYKAKS